MSGVGREYISYARQLSSEGCYKKSVDLYFMAFEKSPQLKLTHEPEFRAIMIKMNEALEAENKIDEILNFFGRAINIFPSNIYLLNEIGKYLFKLGFLEEAWSQFQKALNIDAGYVLAERNLNSLKNLLVERWHFRMLNDSVRNYSYHTAIAQKVIPKETTILDLGTGTGLLSMYATKRNPKSITACDSSKAMASLADIILHENDLLMSVMVLNKISTSLHHSELGGKCTLLITELFDAGLFGEHVLKSLSHAWENLLTPDAEVIPRKAEFFIVGANSQLLSSKYQLCPEIKCLLQIPYLSIHITTDETYDCEDVCFYEDLQFITSPEKVIEIDFQNVQDINDKLNNSEEVQIELKAVQKGEINTFIGWFNLHLTDSITITTDPRSYCRANAWQQAVFFDNPPKDVDENGTFVVNFSLQSEKLTLKTISNCDMRISPETLRFLNDTDYTELIKKCIGMACVYLGQIEEIEEVDIIDLCPFPLFGLLMLKRGVRSLICYAKTELDKLFIEEIVRVNNIPESKVTYLVGDTWTQDCFNEQKYHAIICHIFDSNGDIDIRLKDIAQHLKTTHLIEGGLFMPANISLIGRVVFSNWLDITNRVNDYNVGYKMSMHINKYQVSQNFGIVYTHLEYSPLTDPIYLGNCYQLTQDVINVPIINTGFANAIVCWYDIELMENVCEITTQRPQGFVDGMAFLLNPHVPMIRGKIANVLLCVDPDGCFKLILDTENA